VKVSTIRERNWFALIEPVSITRSAPSRIDCNSARSPLIDSARVAASKG